MSRIGSVKIFCILFVLFMVSASRICAHECEVECDGCCSVASDVIPDKSSDDRSDTLISEEESYAFHKDVNVLVVQDDSIPETMGSDSIVVKKRYPLLAGALSFILPGCGQYYNGQSSKGTLMLSIYVTTSFLGMTLMIGNTNSSLMTGGLLYLTSLCVGVVSITDAVISANRINKKNRLRGIYLGNGKYMVPSLAIIPSADFSSGKISMNPGLALRFSF